MLLPLLTEKRSELAAVLNGDLLRCGAAGGPHSLNLGHNVHALEDLAKDDVPAIEPRSLYRRDEELRTVRAWPSIGRAQEPGAGVLDVKVLIGQLLAINALSTNARAIG